jgi:anti-anti-sigma factor
MSMDIDVTPQGSTTLVKVYGRIVDGPPAEQFHSVLRKLISEEKANTIIDLAEVDWFDSIGIGILISHYVSVSKLGGRVLLLSANDKIKKLMKMVRLDSRFGWADSPEGARAWFENQASKD